MNSCNESLVNVCIQYVPLTKIKQKKTSKLTLTQLSLMTPFTNFTIFFIIAIQCPSNQVHMECGSMCQKTCQSQAAACEDHSCIDGCFCPDGMVLENDTCILQSECPCMQNGRSYAKGSVIPQECNTW